MERQLGGVCGKVELKEEEEREENNVARTRYSPRRGISQCTTCIATREVYKQHVTNERELRKVLSNRGEYSTQSCTAQPSRLFSSVLIAARAMPSNSCESSETIFCGGRRGQPEHRGSRFLVKPPTHLQPRINLVHDVRQPLAQAHARRSPVDAAQYVSSRSRRLREEAGCRGGRA